MLFERRQLQDQLTAAFADIRGDRVLLHTDLPRLGINLRGVRSRSEYLDVFTECLRTATANRELIFPTFNYDFLRNGLYCPDDDPCQVGVLNEHVRRHWLRRRTLTPVFNFCHSDSCALDPGPAGNVFGESSAFAELCRGRAVVAFLGAEYRANTFLHHVEETQAVPYRYLKAFRGRIVQGDTSRDVKIVYRVRPLGVRQTYGFGQLEAGVRQAGLLHERIVGGGKLLWIGATDLLEWGERMLAADELAFLDEPSKAETRELFTRHGRPLPMDAFEGVDRKCQ